MRRVHSPALPLPLLLLLATATRACAGAPVSTQSLSPDVQLQLLNEIEEVCAEARFQALDALGHLCYLAVHQTQDPTARDDAKRFLFHYTKSQGSGQSDTPLVPQLHARRLRRITVGILSLDRTDGSRVTASTQAAEEVGVSCALEGDKHRRRI
ncbi:neuromedin-U [Arapaima gigas]